MKTLFYLFYIWLLCIVGGAVFWLCFSIILPVALDFVINHTFIMPSAERIVRAGVFWIVLLPGLLAISTVYLQFLQAKYDELTVFEKFKLLVFFSATLATFGYFGVKFSHLLVEKILSH